MIKRPAIKWPALATLKLCALAAALGGCALGGDSTLHGAARDYPPLILGANTASVADAQPLACPVAPGRVEQKGGPTMEYLGADPKNPDLCRMRVGGDETEAWFAIWDVSWPGADDAYPALKRLIRGKAGDVEGIDVRIAPGFAYHDLMRNEGVEDIPLRGTTYHALKISHYREGFDGNIYRSVSTVWKDIPSGLLVYGTYQHISGTPVIDDPLLPTEIVPAAAVP